MMMNLNLFGYTYKIYDIGYKTEMMNKECNAGDPLETREAYIEDHLLMKIQYLKRCACRTLNLMFVYYECQSVTVVVRAVSVQSF